MKLSTLNIKSFIIRIAISIGILFFIPLFFILKSVPKDISYVTPYLVFLSIAICIYLMLMEKKTSTLWIIAMLLFDFLFLLVISDFQLTDNIFITISLMIAVIIGSVLLTFSFNQFSQKKNGRNIRIFSLNGLGYAIHNNRISFLDLVYSMIIVAYFLTSYIYVIDPRLDMLLQ